MYHFGEFTCSLNQEEEGVSATDSRLRPDLRLMEAQKFDEANRVKTQLEELQRARRKARELESQEATEQGRVFEGYKPRWFEETEDELSESKIFVYKGGYWESKEKQEWSSCPKIYLDSTWWGILLLSQRLKKFKTASSSFLYFSSSKLEDLSYVILVVCEWYEIKNEFVIWRRICSACSALFSSSPGQHFPCLVWVNMCGLGWCLWSIYAFDQVLRGSMSETCDSCLKENVTRKVRLNYLRIQTRTISLHNLLVLVLFCYWYTTILHWS